MPHTQSPDGTKLYYEEAGTGHPVLFIHEFALPERQRTVWDCFKTFGLRLLEPQAPKRTPGHSVTARFAARQAECSNFSVPSARKWPMLRSVQRPCSGFRHAAANSCAMTEDRSLAKSQISTPGAWGCENQTAEGRPHRASGPALNAWALQAVV